MSAADWVATIHRLHAPTEAQYERCLQTERVYGVGSRQAKTEYAKLAAMLTSIAVEHFRVWLEDYTQTMIGLIPKIGKQAVLSNLTTLELACAEWQSELIVDCRNRIASIRTEEDSILRVQVSGFKDYHSTDPVSVELLKFLRNKKYAPQVDLIRATTDKATRDAMKAKIPCICPSGTFTKRSEAGLVAHSGFIQFDIDAKDNPAYFEGIEDPQEFAALCESIKAELSKQPFIAYVGLSVSGRGLWGLIPISDPSEHKQHFESIVLHFANLGLVIDRLPSNVASLRGYSYDAQAYFNHSAEKYTHKVYPIEREVKQFDSTSFPQESEYAKVARVVNVITQQRIDITNGYGNWLKIAFALSHEFGENGRDLFHDVSQFHPNYNFAATNRKYDHCLKVKSRSTIGTFYMIAAEYGVRLKNVSV